MVTPKWKQRLDEIRNAVYENPKANGYESTTKDY